MNVTSEAKDQSLNIIAPEDNILTRNLVAIKPTTPPVTAANTAKEEPLKQTETRKANLDPYVPFIAISQGITTLAGLQFTNLSIPIPESQDIGFKQLVIFLSLPTSRSYCVLLQRYSHDLIAISKSIDDVAAHITASIKDFASKLITELDVDLNPLCDGLESFLSALGYDLVKSRFLVAEKKQDMELCRRITLIIRS